jgi:hypothetical protein
MAPGGRASNPFERISAKPAHLREIGVVKHLSEADTKTSLHGPLLPAV